ncbi:unnamed protein product [Paramecium primaurelia]|uniref:Uncharacterized protein n=1 Tax=Paramecium primaurelia TaxID=5886 RepID=A0A8S1JYY0_PARPR|nr:unnamed protein product [Paramecium primaurelia]
MRSNNQRENQEKRVRKPSRYKFQDEEEIDQIIKSCEKSQKSRKLRKLSQESSMEVEEEEDEQSDSQYESDYNEDYCWKCRQKNRPLLCCDSCYRSFHMACVGIKKMPAGSWYCPQCCQYEQSYCPYCDEQSTNEKIICSKCNTFIHFECILKDIPFEAILRSPVNRKQISEEQFQQLLLADRPTKTSPLIFHCCLRCLQSFGVGQILTHLKIKEKQCYLILLEQSSYLHCHFFSQAQVQIVNQRKLKNYIEKNEGKQDTLENDNDADLQASLNYIEEDILEYLEPERIIGCKRGANDQKKTWREIYNQEMPKITQYGTKNNYKFLIKWSRMFYEESSWEDAYFIMEKNRDEFKRFLKSKILEETYGTPEYDQFIKQFLKVAQGKSKKNQPVWITGGQLHQFQLQGLQWLQKSYETSNNVILADEMGLGKTIQTISFLNFLQYEHKKSGPFLIIGPATILYNWLKELKKWAETFNVIVYTGNQESRDIIKAKEFYYSNNNNVCKFNVLITSYDIAIIDQAIIKKINWECLIIDEAHRLKNNDSKFFKVCSQFSSQHIILLTGTPLQNNLQELINLIEFIAPQKVKQLKKEQLNVLFNNQDLEDFQEVKKTTLTELNSLLKPHILRRTKADVKLQVPEMEEIIIKLCLTDKQKFLYKNVMLRNYEKLKVLDQKKGASKANLLNILMSLRLVCNHPYLFTYKREFPNEDIEEMINQSNKLKFVDRIIPRLLEMQHKMLIFSQFTMMLDLLQHYLQLRGYSYERLDGTTSIMDRQRIIDSFNNSSGKSKIFLLSTRAGGLGINLTSADTIIFTDSDFNPYRDLQAISRAHRMGQTNKVKVFRLVSKYTAEERIIQIATKKLLLEEIIINPINKFSKDDFQSIFKESTWELFNKNLEEKDQEFTDEQLNILLQRDIELQSDQQYVNLKKNDINDYYLSGFKFTSFNLEQVEKEGEESHQNVNLDKYWETFLDEEAKGFAEKEQDEFGKGKRLKKQNMPNYHEDYHQFSSSQYSPSDQSQGTGSEQENDENKKDQKVVSERMQKLIDKDLQIMRFFQQTVLEHSELAQLSVENDIVIYGFTAYHRIEFLDFVLSFGMDFDSIDQFYQVLQREKPQCFSAEYKPSNEEFKKYVKEFYSLLLDYEQFREKKNIAFCKINPKDIFYRICGLMYLKKKYQFYQNRQAKFTIKHENYQKNKVQKDQEQIIYKNEEWTNFDDFTLCKYIAEKGFNAIDQIVEDQGYFQFASELQEFPFWFKLFRKIEQIPFEQIQNEEQVKKYLKYWMQQRCLMLMSLIIDSEE